MAKITPIEVFILTITKQEAEFLYKALNKSIIEPDADKHYRKNLLLELKKKVTSR